MKNLLAILCLTFSFSLFASEINISKMRGEVTVDGKTAIQGQSLEVGNKLKAKGKGSFFQITYSNGSKILIKNGSLIIYKNKDKSKSVKLLNGMSFFFINKINKEKFNVHTRHASFGVRGTKFFIQADKKEAYLCVCEGSVVAKNKETKKLVKKNEDIHMEKNSDSGITSANDLMLKMATEGFSEMGVPVL